jgi:plastocyanin
MRKLFVLTTLLVFPALALHAVDVAGSVSFLTKRGQKPRIDDSVVWLEPVKAAGVPKVTPGTFTVASRSKTLLPHVIAVPVGSTVSFPNEDTITHNLFSVSKPNDFDLGFYKRGTSMTKTFDSPGIVNVYCNVHPDMSAVVHVMSTPYYTKANAEGAWTIADVVPGTYRLNAWNEIGGSVIADVEVSKTGVVGQLKLTIDTRKHRKTEHLNKFGKPYPTNRTGEY